MSQTEQLRWLSHLLFLITMLARATYEAGTNDVSEPGNLRRFNELTHRVATFQRHLIDGSVGPPATAFFESLDLELSALGVPSDWIIRRLP